MWKLEGTPLWARVVEKIGLEGAAQLEDNVLRVRAKLPPVGNQEERLRKLLYFIHGGVVDHAAVFWEDDSEDVPKWAAMVLCPGNAALEMHFRKRRSAARLHRVSGGTVGDGVHLGDSRYLNFEWRGRLIHPAKADETLFRCAADLIPQLPIASARPTMEIHPRGHEVTHTTSTPRHRNLAHLRRVRAFDYLPSTNFGFCKIPVVDARR